MSRNKVPVDKVWLRAVLEQYEGPLIRYAARIVGDVDRARDVVQETFLKFVSDGAPREDARVAQWLYTVCRNQAVDICRKEKRMRPLTEQQTQLMPAGGVTPAAGLEMRETTGQVLHMLAGLPTNQQEVIRLRFQSGLSYREIAGVTNLTVSNVGYLIHTAIKTIRDKLNQQSDAPAVGEGGAS